jgi:hypothetical protein
MFSVMSCKSHAAIVSLLTTGPVLDGVIVNRGGTNYTYAFSDLIGVDLTAFNGGGILLPGNAPGGAANAPAGQRAALIEDNRLDTGVINLAVSPTAATINFASPVFNSTGVDLFFLELDDSGNDDLNLRINGIEAVIQADRTPPNAPTRFLTISAQARTGNATTLTALENNVYANIAAISPIQAMYAFSIDLSDFNVAPGASITSLQFGSGVNDNQRLIDPVFIGGFNAVAVPEPSSLAILGIGMAACVARRRQTRKLKS